MMPPRVTTRGSAAAAAHKARRGGGASALSHSLCFTSPGSVGARCCGYAAAPEPWFRGVEACRGRVEA
eukprot:11504-Prymnesium_polylepis.1